MTTPASSSAPAARPAAGGGGCGGDGCLARDPWPLHHVRHRGVFCRLCSSCVLRYHPGLFCSSCLSILPSPESGDFGAGAAAGELVHCTKCPSVSHLACLPSHAAAASFVCPPCSSTDPFSFAASSGRRAVDERSARVLLAAARLAASSMGRAAAAARAEAERKVRDAAVARKRAREMLEKVFADENAKKDRKRLNGPAAPEPKKAAATATTTTTQKKQPTNRDRDKWLKFTTEISVPPLVHRAGAAMAAAAAAAAAHGAMVSGDVKKVALAAAAAARSSVGLEPNETPKKSDAEDKKAPPLSPQGTNAKETNSQ